MEFVVPNAPEDLLAPDAGCPRRYQVVPPRQEAGPSLLKELAKGEVTVGAHNFDLFHHFLTGWGNLDTTCRLGFGKTLADAARALLSKLGTLKLAELCGQEKTEWRSSVKMAAFLMQWLVALSGKGATETTAKASGKRACSATVLAKEAVLAILCDLAELDLPALWAPADIEDEFLRLFAKAANSFLDSPTNLKDPGIKEAVFALLSILCCKYQRSASVLEMWINQVVKCEHAAACFAEYVHIYVCNHGHHLFCDVIRELCQFSDLDMSHNADSARNLGSCLILLAESMPSLTLHHLPGLLGLLESEAYPLRNSVVASIGILLRCGLSHMRPSLLSHSTRCPSHEEQTAVDQHFLFAVLQQRDRDISSYCRSRVLQTWGQICECGALPVGMFSRVAEIAQERLSDKAVQVRKNAIQLLSLLLQHNPFGPGLDSMVLQQRLRTMRKGDKTYSHMEQAIKFAEKAEECLSLVSQLLFSRNATEVVEAINFLVVASKFTLRNSSGGVVKLMSLIWSTDKGIKAAVLSACKDLYAPLPSGNHKPDLLPLVAAGRLVELTLHSTLADVSALANILPEMLEQNIFPAGLLDTLLDIFASRLGRVQPGESKAALIVLTAAASRQPSFILRNIAPLIKIGLRADQEDHSIAYYTCLLLQNTTLQPKASEPSTSLKLDQTKEGRRRRPKPVSDREQDVTSFQKLDASHKLFIKLRRLLHRDCRDHGWWFAYAEQAINAVYALAQDPAGVCQQTIRDLLLTCSVGDQSTGQMAISRVVFLLGHIALQHLIWLEERQLSLQRDLSAPVAEPADMPSDAELGMALANEDERGQELLHQITECALVNDNLLGRFLPIIFHVSMDPQLKDGILKTSAVLALSKFMCISGRLCEGQLRTLFTIAETADETLRANIAVAIGDIACRFPNLIEPWTSQVYAMLQDPSARVRRSMLMVLTHLVLNDMIKVRGHVALLALCLADPDLAVRQLSVVFFRELSQKGQTIFNLLPDAISQLTVDQKISKTTKHEIFKQLLAFINKERQTECLVEKFCVHLHATEDKDGWEDFAYCLSLLNYNERALYKLVELQKCYSHTFVDPNTVAQFYTIIGKARKFAKTEQQAAVNELVVTFDKLQNKAAFCAFE